MGVVYRRGFKEFTRATTCELTLFGLSLFRVNSFKISSLFHWQQLISVRNGWIFVGFIVLFNCRNRIKILLAFRGDQVLLT